LSFLRTAQDRARGARPLYLSSKFVLYGGREDGHRIFVKVSVTFLSSSFFSVIMKKSIGVVLSALVSLFVATAVLAQPIRQTHLYIDDGNGHFMILSAPSGGGSLTFPASGTLATTTGVVLTAPGSAQIIQPTADALVPLTILAHSATQSVDLQDWQTAGPTTTVASVDNTGDITTTGFINLSGGTTATTGIEIGGTTSFWGSTLNSGVYAGLGAGAASGGDCNLSVGFGWNALHANPPSGGLTNVAFGDHTLELLTSGSGNAALGFGALERTNGTGNTGIGAGAMAYLGSSGGEGDYNTVVGYAALLSATASYYNAVVGAYSLSSNLMSGDYEATLGYNTLTQNTSGSYNIAIGFYAGTTFTPANANTTGDYNMYIGAETGPASSTQYNESAAIGAFATVGESDAIVLGAIASQNGETDGVTTKVGIGTNQPAALLSVGTSSAMQVDASGNIRTTGTVKVGSHVFATSEGTAAPTGASPSVTVGDNPVFVILNTGTPTGTITLSMPASPAGTGDVIIVINNTTINATIGAVTILPGDSRTFYYDGTAWQ